ncbi:hypothetical protein LP419_05735 [Massilia sp. H-1]|nr:hypothetical protein LP419_05735 [Massilia sp. H-1]
MREGGKLAQRTEAISAHNEAKAERDDGRDREEGIRRPGGLQHDSAQSVSAVEGDARGKSRRGLSIYREHRQGFLSRLGQNLQGGWDGLQDFVLALVGIWLKRW